MSKSIITCFIAAATTKGLLWPDWGIAPQGSVVFLACEDDSETTIGPRLKATGADLNKITMINGKKPDGESGGKGFVLAVSLQDLELIEQVLPPDCKVLIIDPAGSHIGPGVDNHRYNEVRDMLMPLAQLARKRAGGNWRKPADRDHGRDE